VVKYLRPLNDCDIYGDNDAVDAVYSHGDDEDDDSGGGGDDD